jgi:hypothetical protein
MLDDKQKLEAGEAKRFLGTFDYDVEYFARHHGIDIEEARRLINKFGDDRHALYHEVARLKN